MLSQDRVTIVLLAVGQDLYLLDNTSCAVVVSERGATRDWAAEAGETVCLSFSRSFNCRAQANSSPEPQPQANCTAVAGFTRCSGGCAIELQSSDTP